MVLVAPVSPSHTGLRQVTPPTDVVKSGRDNNKLLFLPLSIEKGPMNKSLTNNIKYNHICNYTYIKVEKRREKRRGFVTEKKK